MAPPKCWREPWGPTGVPGSECMNGSQEGLCRPPFGFQSPESLAGALEDQAVQEARQVLQQLHSRKGKAGQLTLGTLFDRYALEALTRFRAAHPGVGQGPVFPHPRQKRHPGKPVDRHLAAYWLKQAYELSGLAKPEGSLWHTFRRQWATERKHLPVKDVAAAGGWNDVTTLIKSDQQPDEQTLRST
jgi:hypothetical protein